MRMFAGYEFPQRAFAHGLDCVERACARRDPRGSGAGRRLLQLRHAAIRCAGRSPPQRYGEIYAPQPVYREGPRSYRVVVYPEYPLPYGTYQVPSPPYPPVGYGGEFADPYGYGVAEAPRRYVRPAYAGGYVHNPYRDLPYEPYGRAVDPYAPIPPGLVGPPRW